MGLWGKIKDAFTGGGVTLELQRAPDTLNVNNIKLAGAVRLTAQKEQTIGEVIEYVEKHRKSVPA